MIVSASRRTDVPAFYGEWFRERLAAGFCRVANPFNPKQVATVDLRREAVDAFVLWTRDPRPFAAALDDLDELGYPYVFLFTLTGYGRPLEAGSPPVATAVAAFRDLAARLGPERVSWRYDPVVLGPGLEVDDHLRRFADLAGRLTGATDTVVVSFLDLYRKTQRRLRGEGCAAFLRDPLTEPGVERLVDGLATIAAGAGMRLQSCAEDPRIADLGLQPGACIDGPRLGGLFGFAAEARKDLGQRRLCRCTPSRDIGAPDSCLHGCVYCYATRSRAAAHDRHSRHHPTDEALAPLGPGSGYQGSA